jgi:hypothetical protein
MAVQYNSSHAQRTLDEQLARSKTWQRDGVLTKSRKVIDFAILSYTIRSFNKDILLSGFAPPEHLPTQMFL